MTSIAPELRDRILELPHNAREELVELLFTSLEQDCAVERAWIAEAERRYALIRSGEDRLVDDDEVMAELDARFP